MVTVTLELPDDIAQSLASYADGDLSRRALESFGLEEFKSGRLLQARLRRLLGLTRYELDGFLKAHGVFWDYSIEEFDKEWETLQKAGF